MIQYAPLEAPTRLPVKVVIGSVFGLWLVYFLLITLRGSVVGLDMQGELLWRRGIVCVVGAAVTLVLWRVIRLVETRSFAINIAVALIAALPASLVIAKANQELFAPLQEKAMKQVGREQGANVYRDEAGNLLVDVPRWPVDVEGQEAPRPEDQSKDGIDRATFVLAPALTGIDRWRQITDIALGRYFLLLAWVSLYLALLAGARARRSQQREERFRSAAKASELRSLRYQVNPHFLFNTLNSLSALVLTEKGEKAEEMIQTISRFYRHSLAEDPTGDVALADEFELQQHYLDIEQVRFPERLRTQYELPADLANCLVPGMILQPLVENSVKYGVSRQQQSR